MHHRVETSPPVGKTTDEAAELRATEALLAGGGQQNHASRLDDVRRCRYPFHALIIGQIQRVASAGSDDRIHRLITQRQGGIPYKGDSRRMANDGVTSKHPCNLP